MARLVFLGPPGAGKGTHAQILTKDLSVPHISTGDMLREAIRAGSALGLKAKECMDQGLLVSDEIVIGLVRERLSQPDAKKGFILDGFPRTPEQADSLDRTLGELAMPLELVLYFKTSRPVIIKRLCGRRICGGCAKNYHVTNFPPKKEGICDACGAALIQRPDDREDAIEKRLVVYEKQTEPLIEYYAKRGVLAEISGDLEVEPLRAVLSDLFKTRVPGAVLR